MRCELALRGAVGLAATILAAGLIVGPGLTHTAKAASVDGRSTTVVAAEQNVRDRGVRSVVPFYELLSVSAKSVDNPFLQDMRLAISGWGRPALGDPRDGQLTGDLTLAFVEGRALGKRLQLRLGRQLVYEGALRNLHVDGLYARGEVAGPVWLSAFAGVPVASRFGTKRGDFTAGGRVAARLGFSSEIGVSFLDELLRGRVARQDVGVDGLYVIRKVTLSAYGSFSTPEQRLVEGNATAFWQARHGLSIGADYRRVAPDLFLPLGSIFSVFSEELSQEMGGIVVVEPLEYLEAEAEYHFVSHEIGRGHDVGGGVRMSLGPNGESTVGLEGRVLVLKKEGYKHLRLWTQERFTDKLGMSFDVNSFFFDAKENKVNRAIDAAATLTYAVNPDLSLAGSASWDSSPLFKSRFLGMARVIYQPRWQTKATPQRAAAASGDDEP